jgi:hypothetical protein
MLVPAVSFCPITIVILALSSLLHCGYFKGNNNIRLLFAPLWHPAQCSAHSSKSKVLHTVLKSGQSTWVQEVWKVSSIQISSWPDHHSWVWESMLIAYKFHKSIPFIYYFFQAGKDFHHHLIQYSHFSDEETEAQWGAHSSFMHKRWKQSLSKCLWEDLSSIALVTGFFP